MDRPLKRSFWRRVAPVIGPALGLVAIVGVCGFILINAQTTLALPRSSVSVGKAEAGFFQDFAPIRATVVARDVISIDSGEGGQVTKVLARSGDIVRAGQALVQFRNPDLEMQVQERQSRQVNAINGLRSELKALDDSRSSNAMEAARMTFELAKLEAEYQRRQALFARGFGAAIDLNSAKNAYELALAMKPLQAEISARAEAQRRNRDPEIRAELQEMRQVLSAIRETLDGLVVKAPADGRLADFVLTIGERKNKSELIGKLTLTTGFKLNAPIDPFYLGRIRIGQSADVLLPLLDQTRTLRAHISRIDPQVKEGVFHVELEFTAPPDQLLEGQALDGHIMLGEKKRALVVPAGPWLDATGGNWVMVLDPDGRSAHRRMLKTGKRSEAQVEVLSGLIPGERIITSSHQTFEKIKKIELSK